jgi:RNA polymerase sigma-B factor
MTNIDESRDPADEALFEELRTTGRRSVRNLIVERHMGLAIHIARSFHRGPVADRDLEQVAMIGLVKAVDRFDPSFGVPFVGYAGRTIEGELKRYFRDATWAVKVPRGAKDLHVAVRRSTDNLSAQLGRSPTVDEVAADLQVSRDDVISGLAAGEARRVGTLDPASGGDTPVSGDRMSATAVVDRGFDDVVDRRAVQVLLEGLPERERTIVELRFFEELSQSDIAERVGVSQMHVSRLLRRALEQLRFELDTPTAEEET